MLNRCRGKIYVVGIGPGALELRTIAVLKAIEESSVVLGYKRYIDFIRDVLVNKRVVEYGMREEVERVKKAVEYALNGEIVALVSGGDPQVYGMAGILLEYIAKNGIDVDVTIIPGVTAALAAAAKLGAPLASDFAVINLSDILIPREVILSKVEHAAKGDFVIVFYNPVKLDLVEQAMNTVARFRSSDTPVGIARNVYRDGEKVFVTRLKDWIEYRDYIDMGTTIIVGSSKTIIYRNYMVTQRGYRL
ncbi:MAG: precorrin-3B C(17)-methyltransferase [Ignisphaera sp.]|uniref:Precorrin-3B C(17)-methyltransferase n=1 Tax=Ignisphaera aggregans TaxID=334771 RepID=A0A832APV0_9CREN